MRPLTDATRQLLSPLPLHERDQLNIDLDKDGSRFIVEIFREQLVGGSPMRGWASNVARHDFPLRVPERKKLDSIDPYTEKWLMAATDFTVGIIAATWPVQQVTLTPEARVIYEYHRLTLAQTDRAVEVRARFAHEGELPDGEIEVNEDYPLAGYQQLACKLTGMSDGYALFMEQGTGKSAVVVSRVCTDAKAHEKMYRVLIVCPKNVRMNWRDEFEKFGTVPGKVTVLRGGPIRRVKQLIEACVPQNGEKYSVVVCSYETMTKMIRQFTAVPWHTTVLDESHSIKWPRTQRAMASVPLRDASERRIILTGTPICNNPLDIYSQLEFLGRGRSGFVSWENFRSFYGKFERTQFGDKLVGLQNMAFMRERLARHSFQITKKEALPDLPEKVYDVVECEMSEEQQLVYDRVRDELVIECESMLAGADSEPVAINNVLTKMLKLAQITSGFLVIPPIIGVDGTVEQPKQLIRFKDVPKLDELMTQVDELGENEKMIVWTCWTDNIAMISERLASRGIQHVTFQGSTSDDERERAKDAFNNDPLGKVFIGNSTAGGTGINLVGYTDPSQETNCTRVVYFSQNWSPIARWQSEDRAHRRTTRVTVRVSDLCVAETIDEEIRRRTVLKKLTAATISDVRDILRNVLGAVK